MEKPVLSPDFTLEDIRKIRTYNASLREKMTWKEYKEYIDNKAAVVLEKMARLKEKAA
jgi:hypothetical protein